MGSLTGWFFQILEITEIYYIILSLMQLKDPNQRENGLEMAWKMTETIPYEITGNAGEIEFRKYPAIVLATVDSSGDDSGFSLLFAYITGNNHMQQKISMTSPLSLLVRSQ